MNDINRLSVSEFIRKLAYAAAIWAVLAQGASAGCTLALVGEFTVEHGRAVTTGQIDGKPVRVLIDTGSDFSFVQGAAVRRLGLRLSNAGAMRVLGSSGESKVHVTSISSLKIGTLAWTHLTPFVVGDDSEQSADEPEFVLSDDVLSNFDTELDLAHDKIRLFHALGCRINQVAYWAHTFSLADLENLNPDDPEIVARALLNTLPVGARLASASSVSIISRKASELVGVTPWREHPTPVGHVSFVGEQPIADWIGTFETFSIGDEKIGHVPLTIADLYRGDKVADTGSHLTHTERADTMTLGMDFLMAHRILVMPEKSKMVFTYNGGPVFRTKTE